jgi:TetR/AcrR family transcriptional regulator, tetracycline repressor protein
VPAAILEHHYKQNLMAVDKSQILNAALDLLDAVGLEGLTMRRLAQELNIQAPSLYWHFASRRALLDGMADAMLEPVARSVPKDAQWEQVVRSIAGQMRYALRARRDGAKLFAGTYPVSENILRTGDVLLKAIRTTGCGPKLSGWATFTLLYYVLGFVIEEQAVGPSDGDSEISFAALRDRAANHGAEHPTLVEALPAIFDEDFDGRFEFGLDLFLSGLNSVLSKNVSK